LDFLRMAFGMQEFSLYAERPLCDCRGFVHSTSLTFTPRIWIRGMRRTEHRNGTYFFSK